MPPTTTAYQDCNSGKDLASDFCAAGVAQLQAGAWRPKPLRFLLADCSARLPSSPALPQAFFDANNDWPLPDNGGAPVPDLRHWATAGGECPTAAPSDRGAEAALANGPNACSWSWALDTETCNRESGGWLEAIARQLRILLWNGEYYRSMPRQRHAGGDGRPSSVVIFTPRLFGPARRWWPRSAPVPSLRAAMSRGLALSASKGGPVVDGQAALRGDGADAAGSGRHPST